MKWRINYSKEAWKFIEKHNIHSDVKEELKKLLKKLKGEDTNLDLKKLFGVLG